MVMSASSECVTCVTRANQPQLCYRCNMFEDDAPQAAQFKLVPDDELSHHVPAAEGIGARIRYRRWQLRMSRAQLSGAVDVTRAYLSMIEAGKRQPSSARLDAIARALDTD